jgi:uncharacterized protein
VRIISITDLHGNRKNIDSLYKQCGAVDLTLITGDLTDFGKAGEAQEVIEAVRAWCPDVLAVAGNCDYPDVEDYLHSQKISLHRTAAIRHGHTFVGMGKSLPCPGATPNETNETDFAAGLDEAAALAPMGLSLILVVHQPPWNTLNDRVFFGKHVGSKSIREFIVSRQPIITFCGHIHEGTGIDTIGETRLINPGPLAKGHFGYAELTASGWNLEIRSIKN